MTRWMPRPFFENHSKEDFKEWFANVTPWNRLDTRIIEALIEKFYGNPMFEVFVHTSHNCNLIKEYSHLKYLFDRGDVTIYPHIATLLYKKGEKNCQHLFHILDNLPINEKEAKKHYAFAMDTLESSIHIDPNCLPSYVLLAFLKLRMGKKKDAKNFCKLGLEQISKIKKLPLQKSELPEIRKYSEEIEDLERKLISIETDL